MTEEGQQVIILSKAACERELMCFQACSSYRVYVDGDCCPQTHRNPLGDGELVDMNSSLWMFPLSTHQYQRAL